MSDAGFKDSSLRSPSKARRWCNVVTTTSGAVCSMLQSLHNTSLLGWIELEAIPRSKENRFVTFLMPRQAHGQVQILQAWRSPCEYLLKPAGDYLQAKLVRAFFMDTISRLSPWSLSQIDRWMPFQLGQSDECADKVLLTQGLDCTCAISNTIIQGGLQFAKYPWSPEAMEAPRRRANQKSFQSQSLCLLFV